MFIFLRNTSHQLPDSAGSVPPTATEPGRPRVLIGGEETGDWRDGQFSERCKMIPVGWRGDQ